MDEIVRVDIIGRTLQPGNAVAFALSSSHMLEVGYIKQFTKKMARIEYRASYGGVETVLRYPGDLSLLEGPALVEYQLKRG